VPRVCQDEQIRRETPRTQPKPNSR
jgi:hypothetical protein